ncbi:MAG: hypothetical protein FWE37_03030 [Spirochaetaceae bacterium]|nr:hypothetical protein [Spirochaetaceae bacterium]
MQKLTEPLVVVQLDTTFTSPNGNSARFETGTLTVLIYGQNDEEVIQIGQEIMDIQFNIKNINIVIEGRTAFKNQIQLVDFPTLPVGFVTFTINMQI